MPKADIATHQAKYTLNKLHAELAGKILDNKKEAERLIEAMVHVEAVLKLLDPSFNIGTIAVRRRKHNPWFKRGTLFRHALTVLRKAEKPLTTYEIVNRMIAAKGVKEPASADVRTVFGAVATSLRNNTGKMIERVGDGYPARWSIRA
jgi:hypothetical protein